MELENEIEELQRKEFELDNSEEDEDTSEELDTEEEEETNGQVFNENVAVEQEPEETYVIDVCDTHFCGAGKECAKNEAGEAFCQCVVDCPRETDPRRKTCSN